MTEYQYDYIFTMSSLIDWIFKLGLLYISIGFLKIKKGERK